MTSLYLPTPVNYGLCLSITFFLLLFIYHTTLTNNITKHLFLIPSSIVPITQMTHGLTQGVYKYNKMMQSIMNKYRFHRNKERTKSNN